jgi:hypothetical protein
MKQNTSARHLPLFACAAAALFLLGGCRLSPAAGDAPARPAVYVSPSGSDQNPGTKAKPFATLARARDAARARCARRRRRRRPWPCGCWTAGTCSPSRSR